jgi:hypothetical protein
LALQILAFADILLAEYSLIETHAGPRETSVLSLQLQMAHDGFTSI